MTVEDRTSRLEGFIHVVTSERLNAHCVTIAGRAHTAGRGRCRPVEAAIMKIILYEKINWMVVKAEEGWVHMTLKIVGDAANLVTAAQDTFE